MNKPRASLPIVYLHNPHVFLLCKQEKLYMQQTIKLDRTPRIRCVKFIHMYEGAQFFLPLLSRNETCIRNKYHQQYNSSLTGLGRYTDGLDSQPDLLACLCRQGRKRVPWSHWTLGEHVTRSVVVCTIYFNTRYLKQRRFKDHCDVCDD